MGGGKRVTHAPDGNEHPPWNDSGRTYGPSTPGGYTAAIRDHRQSIAGGGLWDPSVGGGGERLARLYDEERGPRRLSTVSGRAQRAAKAADPRTMTPIERQVYEAALQGHAPDWIAPRLHVRRSHIERLFRRWGLGARG